MKLKELENFFKKFDHFLIFLSFFFNFQFFNLSVFKLFVGCLILRSIFFLKNCMSVHVVIIYCQGPSKSCETIFIVLMSFHVFR